MSGIKGKRMLETAAAALIYPIVYSLIILIFGNNPRNLYVADWVAMNHFFFLWAVAMFFAYTGDRLSAIIITAGCFAGIGLGQIIGDIVARPTADAAMQALIAGDYDLFAQLHNHPGWVIWIVTMIVSLTGVLALRWRKSRKNSNEKL